MEKAEKERDELKLTLEKFQNLSKSLNSLLESQISDRFKTGLGYNAVSSTATSPAVESLVSSFEILENQEYNKSKFDKQYHVVPPPYTGNFIPSKPDVMFLDEIVESENLDVTTVTTPSNSNHESTDKGDKEEPKTIRINNSSAPIIEDWNSDDESEVDYILAVKNTTIRPSTDKIKFVKTAMEIVGKVETPKQNKHYLRGNQRNWNNLMSQRLGSDFKLINKACYVCGSFEHLHYVCDKKGNPQQKEYKEKELLTVVVLGRITGNGKIKTCTLDFDVVHFCKELKYNLFSVSQICDKRNNVLFTDTECLVLSSDFKLLDERQVLLRVPRKDNIYSVDLKSVVPTGGLTCLFAKATIDESNLW
ncbi:hypothetical protein Tco_1364857, partial [Tanacetum coccineum]